MPEPVRVLFMQSQAYFGADSAVHARLMRHFDRHEVAVHVACTTARVPPPALTALDQLQAIPDVHIRRTNFGPSLFGSKTRRRARAGIALPAAAVDLLRLAAYIRRRDIRIIHGTEKPRDAFYGVLLGKLTGAKSVVHVHVKYADWLSPPVKWALRHADAIVGVSNYVAQTLTDAGYRAERVFGVGNSLDELQQWNPDLDGAPVRHALGLGDDTPVVGIVARLFSWKGHRELLQATAIVKRDFPQVRVLVVGEDDPRAHPGGGSYRAELVALADELDIAENVIFTGFRADVAAVLAALDVYAMPSWEEPWGMIYLEAMAMRKPVVAWRSGGVPEVVLHDQTGILTPPRDIPALAEAISTLLRRPDLRKQLGAAGRERAEHVLTPQRMCREVLDVYRRTLSRAAGAVGAPPPRKAWRAPGA